MPKTYYSFSQKLIVMNDKSFNAIKDDLYDAVVVNKYGLMYVYLSHCPFAIHNPFGIYRKNKKVDKKTSCQTCLHRLRKMSGSNCYNYEAIESHNYNTGDYIIKRLNDNSAMEDESLVDFINYCEYPDDYYDEREMTYQEYQSLLSFISFFEKTSHLFLKIKRMFSKIF